MIEVREYTSPVGERIPVLDHGYLQLVEAWGSDARIVESARMSTGKGFLGWGPQHAGDCPKTVENEGEDLLCTCSPSSGDEKLLRFLYMSEPQHGTPFEMAGATFEVQAPIFVFREWHRHRVPFGYNEMSARYTPLPDLNYIPSMDRLMVAASGTNKQAGLGKGAEPLTVEKAERYRLALRDQYAADQAFYEQALLAGVPKELARVHLPVGRYSRMRATGNLRGWLGFLTLRSHPAAQYEIRQYSNALGNMIASLFPRTWALFEEKRGAPRG